MKKLVFLVCFVSIVFAAKVHQPFEKYTLDGSVIDMVYKQDKLYCATAVSSVEVVDIKSKKIIQKIQVNKIKDFMGDEIDAKVYSVDELNGAILLLTQASKGYREIYIFKDNKLTNIISFKDKLDIARAKFLDDNTILFALLGNDIISYDIKNHKQNWTRQASQSKFSYFALNEDKTKVVVADESGDLHIIDTKTSKLIKVLSGENLDNVFQVVYKNGYIATAGQDRRAVVYNAKTGQAYYKTASFLIYSVGLSPKAKIVAYASDENNNVTLFKRSTHSNIGLYGGNKMTLSKIIFKNEKEFFVASDDKVVNHYKIK
jgi:WD40 repeat protein